MARDHACECRGLVGKRKRLRLYQVAEWPSQGLALLGWAAATDQCHARSLTRLDPRTAATVSAICRQ